MWLVEAYTIHKDLSSEQLSDVVGALINPVTQAAECFSGARAGRPAGVFDWSVEIGFLPGVTDNVGQTARQSIEDLLGVVFEGDEGVYSSQLLFLKGTLSREEAEAAARQLANPLIQRLQVYSAGDWTEDRAQEIVVPRVKLRQQAEVTRVNLRVDEAELEEMGQKGIAGPEGGRRGPLALNLPSMRAIAAYFASLERDPTDIELESIAQTWSEHCKHTIFAGPLDEITNGIYKTYIKAATEKVRRDKGAKDLCVSVFSDNSGAIRFDDEYLVTHKVETHNSPSALDPFGGSVTGIVGVNRDTIGFGMGAQPVINTYGFCVADPTDRAPLYRDARRTMPTLSPRRIFDGVIAGVNFGGNCSGIPTPQGFVQFHPGYKGKPLVFVGTVGLIPARVNGRPAHEKKAHPGDLIVMVGGRVGLDGVHGATFSSVALDESSPATAVQIGDPITQKKLSDAIVKEARDMDLYSSITDNGAGGLSCSVAEMAQEAGGFSVELEKVPLKYPDLAPWQIWVSESQERMTLAVPPRKWAQFRELMQRRGVEATVIGTFTDGGRCLVTYHDETVLDLEMDFLHDGLPQVQRHSTLTPMHRPEPQRPAQPDWEAVLTAMLQRPNLASFDFISRQYDHEVQAGSVLKPLVGRGQVNGEASVTRPVLSSPKGVALSQALYPTYSELDPYAMAGAAIDTAIRNLVAVGADPDSIALLDNFCWCSPNEPERLGQLRRAAEACYDYAVAYGAPFISGKDSMFNDFRGFDEKGRAVQISIPPTLLVSSIGLVNDAAATVSGDVKAAGDLVYVLGETHDELGGSEYFAYVSQDSAEAAGGRVPQVDAVRNASLYRVLAKAIADGLVASSWSVSRGGLLVALAKTAMAGRLGLDVSLADLPGTSTTDETRAFAESQGRVVVTVALEHQQAFEDLFVEQAAKLVGRVTAQPQLHVRGSRDESLVTVTVDDALSAYRLPFGGF
jgi:phosphoribosylformylglycinamidine synthase II